MGAPSPPGWLSSNGGAAAAWAPAGRLRVAFMFALADGTISAIDMVADPERLRHLEVTIFDH
jgi:hypothetical protein